MTTTHPQGPATTGPANIRPPQRWRLLGLAAVMLLCLAGPLVAAIDYFAFEPAYASQKPLPPPEGYTGPWNAEAATPISCWIPQLPGWAPKLGRNASEADTAFFQHWLATDVRTRSWDGRYEVITRTDKGSAPFCVEVIPGSDWYVFTGDLPAVQAYLLSLGQAEINKGVMVTA